VNSRPFNWRVFQRNRPKADMDVFTRGDRREQELTFRCTEQLAWQLNTGPRADGRGSFNLAKLLQSFGKHRNYTGWFWRDHGQR
jgi:hypothetical protein